VSEAMRELKEEIVHATRLESGAMLFGERGSGKELVARLIHSLSSRREAEFVQIDCAEFDAARGVSVKSLESMLALVVDGTIYFESVDHMPAGMQKELMLRLAPKERDDDDDGEGVKRLPRMLASTALMQGGPACPDGFDPALYSMFAFTKLTVPPLRERLADILPLAQHLFKRELKDVARLRMDLDVIMIMEHYAWPGNVGELEEMVKYVVARGYHDRVRVDDLPETIRKTAGSITSLTVEDLKKEFFQGESLGRFLREQGRKHAEQLKTSMAQKVQEDRKREQGRARPHT
jgi:DNA-binding NtrC family response regulator